MTLYKSTDAYGVVSYSDRPIPGGRAFVFGDRMVEQLETQVQLQANRLPQACASVRVTTPTRRSR